MNKHLISAGFTFFLLLAGACQTQKANPQTPETQAAAEEQAASRPPIWQSEHYAIYPDRVVQKPFESRVLSSTELVSDYKSMAREFQSPHLTFKFSINGKDNEMPSGQDHQFTCLPAQGGGCETPLITFGQQLKGAAAAPPNTYLASNTNWKIRLDMRPVLAAFKKQGFYKAFNGDKIYREDFKGVFVAGNTAPLTWDFDNLANFRELELKDPDQDGIYEAFLVLNPANDGKATAATWKMSRNLSAFPQYKSDYPLADALYNLALEEMVNAVEPDSTFRTGKEWAGVWTRDISYSIILSMAALQPQVARYSLLRKVKNQRIIQDTGTGGAYPASSDRIVWALAAWELYKVTGDQNWLQQAYGIVKNTMEDDLKNVFDARTGLFRGESSFLDWREQTYPEWMQPADIYDSENLGTNVVFYQASQVLSQMAALLGDQPAASKYANLAQQVKKGINEHLWMPEKGYYGQYLYGRNYRVLSPKAEALGEALAVLFGVADSARQKQVVASTPVTPFGITCIYPQIPNLPPYHNNGIWPFVQAYWSMAAAKAGNEAALTESISAIYRPAALLLTNKENFVATSGDYAGTQINSSNMLWSLAGNLAVTYKVFFGMDFQADRLVFAPMVPQAFAGRQQLRNFRYRRAILDLDLEGYGNRIQSITLDGRPLDKAEIPGSLQGRHSLKIVLASQTPEPAPVNRVEVNFAPAAPAVVLSGSRLSWPAQEGVARYRVLKNGRQAALTSKTEWQTAAGDYAEYQVVAIDAEGYESFASEPLVVAPAGHRQVYELENIVTKAALPYKGFSGKGFVEISKSRNSAITLTVSVPEAGLYALDFRYANGEGPLNTQNKCAIRTLKKGDAFLGTVVLPQRGTNEWSDWGFTNAVQVKLEKGKQVLTLSFEPANENMHGEINRALLDYLRVTRLD